MKKIIIIGAGGHAKVIADAIDKSKYFIVGYIGKSSEIGNKPLDIPVIGDDTCLQEMFHNGVENAVLGIGHMGNYMIRERLFNHLESIGFELNNIIHQNTCIANSVKLGKGNVILSGAIINADTVIGNNCIINTGAIIEHDCCVGDNVHIASRSIVYGECNVHTNCLIDTGAVITQGKIIGSNTIITPGTVC